MNHEHTFTIAGISGSLREESFNRRLLEAAAQELPEGVELEIWGGLAGVPPFDEDRELGPVPMGVATLRRVIASADAVLIATPEYNGSMPGVLKNALDWASRPRGAAVLEGKPVATMSASPTPYGGARAQDQLRRVLHIVGADVTGGELAVPQAFEQFDDGGRLAAPELRDRLVELVLALTGPAPAAA